MPEPQQSRKVQIQEDLSPKAGNAGGEVENNGLLQVPCVNLWWHWVWRTVTLYPTPDNHIRLTKTTPQG